MIIYYIKGIIIDNMKLQNVTIEDREYWNVVKGLGILCIVLGHCFMPVQNFVYAFHVPLFFFVSGYLYSEDKYGDEPFENFKRRLQSNWLKYVIIYVIYILLHNVLYSLSLLQEGAEAYTINDFIYQISLALFFGGDEFLISPLWFVPVLVEASVMLGFIVTISRRLFKNVIRKLSFQLIIITAATILGYVIETKEIVLFANYQIALMVMPYIWMGYILRNYVDEVVKYIKWYVAIVAFIILILYTKDHLISMKDRMIRPEMYIMAFLGIYVCLYLSILIKKVGFIEKVFVLMGKATFEIMAFHYTIIRVLDMVYDNAIRRVDFREQEYLGHNMVLLPIYLILGIGIPVLINIIIMYIKRGVNNEK